MKVRLYALPSKNLDSAGYDPAENTMYIRFYSGATYAYPGVDPLVFAELLNAQSVGAHFAALKVRLTEYRRLTDSESQALFGDEPEANQPRTGGLTIV